jgi:predicted HTH domain antitoxin
MILTDVSITVPEGMKMYIQPADKRAELERNALILYPYINNKTISYGRAAEILGIPKYDLIELFDNMGIAYLSMDISEIEEEVKDWEGMKKAGK